MAEHGTGAEKLTMKYHWRFLSALLALCALVQARSARAEDVPPSGLWDAGIVVNGVLIPFRIELAVSGNDASGALFNGDERVRSTSGSYRAGSLGLRFAHYASSLQARWIDGSLTGAYGRSGQPAYAFQARPHSVAPPSNDKVPSIAGQWEIAVKSPKGEAAWRFFVRQSGAEVTASILRVDGDTGALSGSYQGGKFVLSHFSGARPLLLEITPNADGSLALVQNGKAEYTAFKSKQARAKKLPLPADPSRWTSVKDPNQPLRFSAPDLNGKLVTEADPRFKGKVVLVNVMGSWCPNCHDEAPFLQELYRTYRSRGLEIVALSFEDAVELRDPARLRAFIAAYGLDYTVLLGGEPSEVHEKLPQALNLSTWPATFFVARSGLVQGTHAGFAGRATGAAHDELKAELRSTVEKLLAQKP